jgi:hypothetical protein
MLKSIVQMKTLKFLVESVRGDGAGGTSVNTASTTAGGIDWGYSQCSKNNRGLNAYMMTNGIESMTNGTGKMTNGIGDP